MNFYLITYNKNSVLKNYKPLYNAIKTSSISWWHHLDNTWIISTNLNAQDLFNHLAAHINNDDKLLIIQVFQNSDFSGWLTEDAWNWLNHQFGRIR